MPRVPCRYWRGEGGKLVVRLCFCRASQRAVPLLTWFVSETNNKVVSLGNWDKDGVGEGVRGQLGRREDKEACFSLFSSLSV